MLVQGGGDSLDHLQEPMRAVNTGISQDGEKYCG